MTSDMDDLQRPPELMAERREMPRRFSRSRVWVAGLALVAFAGFSWYAYRQATKVGEEGVAPLITAQEGPSRVKPDEPGGMAVPHQDKSVYGRLGNEEPASTKVESLLPEPEAPMPRPAASTPVTVASTTTDRAAPSALPPPPPPSAAEAKSAAKIAPAAGAAAKPAEAAPAKAAKETKVAAAAPAASTAAAPAAKAAGSYRVQLAALRSEAGANTEWKRLQKSFPELLGGLPLTVQKVALPGKGTFYRVQAGALTESAAKKLCAELKRHKAGCLVVKS